MIIRIPGGEEKENKIKGIFEIIMAENFPKLVTDTKPQIQEVHRIPKRINTKNAHLSISYSNAKNQI